MKPKNSLFNAFQIVISLVLAPVLGLYGAITFVRLISNRYYWKSKVVFVSRSIAICSIWDSRISVVMHNIESLYYNEEGRATNSLVYKFIYFHQGFLLGLYEKYILQRRTIICLSSLEARWIKFKGGDSVFLLNHLTDLSREDIVNQCFFRLQSARCFFGSYKNVRNIQMSQELIRMYPQAILFGRDGDCLPYLLKEHYGGEVENLSELTKKFVLTLPFVPRAGIQTKVIDWLESGGRVDIPLSLKRRMSCVN